ncbi:unnamed protein product, partial [Ectocarpus fasciculatus]
RGVRGGCSTYGNRRVDVGVVRQDMAALAERQQGGRACVSAFESKRRRADHDRMPPTFPAKHTCSRR